MSMDLDTATSPTAPAAANPAVVALQPAAESTIKSLSAKYSEIFSRPELYTRPQYHTLRAQTPAPPLTRTATGLCDTPTSSISSSSASPLASSPWQSGRSGGSGSDGAIDNVAAFFSRSTLAEPHEGLWDMDDDDMQQQPIHPDTGFESDKSPVRSATIPMVAPIFTRCMSDSSTVSSRAVKKGSTASSRIKKGSSVEVNKITKYFHKSPVPLVPKPVNVVANAPRCQNKQPTLLGLPITKPVRQQKRKSKDLCSTPAAPPREDKVIKIENRACAVISTATSDTSASTSSITFSASVVNRDINATTRPARPTLARNATMNTYSSWSRKAPASNIAARPIPRPALPVRAATARVNRTIADDAFAHMSSDEDEDEDSAHLEASPTRPSRPRYVRSVTVPIITVCSPPRKSSVPLSCQDDARIGTLYHRDNLRTPSPARPARHAASASTAEPFRTASGPIDMPTRKGRLMKPMPMALITGNDIAASPDSLNLIAALQCGYTAAAFKCPDRNPFL
ncbi:hypothetical protein HDU86_003389 [Geranomyces michiganensis]|nr:hypothetical protein HDU86_003389 [Geranomyces michiganensis]